VLHAVTVLAIVEAAIFNLQRLLAMR